jgi:hypothetical protein
VEFGPRLRSIQRLTNWMQFLAFGCVAVLPILKFYLKDTNMIETVEDIDVADLHEDRTSQRLDRLDQG